MTSALLVLMLVVIGPIGERMDANPPDGLDAPFEALPFLCNDCSDCGFNTHTVHSPAAGDGLYDAALHGCSSHGGCDSHQDCWMQEDDADTEEIAEKEVRLAGIAEAVRMAILTSDAVGLREVLRQPEVAFEVSRGAAQVIGCGGLVVAHFPVPSDLATLVQ